MRRISFRVAFFLSVALLPVGLIAVMQTREVVEQAQARSAASLVALIDRAADSERQAVERAFGAASGLGMSAVTLPAQTCASAFARFTTSNPQFTKSGFITADGQDICRSSQAGLSPELVDDIMATVDDPAPNIELDVGTGERNAALLVTQPVSDPQNGLLGFVYVTLPHTDLSSRDGSPINPAGVTLLTFNGSGRVLTSTESLDTVDRALPRGRDLADFNGSSAQAFIGSSASGERRLFAVSPIVPNVVYAIGSWKRGDGSVGMFPTSVPAPLFPILMWLVSLAVAFAAVNRLVIRHIRKLQQSMRRFALARTLPDPDFAKDMPTEIAEISETFNRMAQVVLRDEAELERAVKDKDVLLKEVHHRVKNNLQLISSIMNMQVRRLRSPEGKIVLRRLQERVLGLATIHRNLYQTENLSRVEADTLLQELVRQMSVLSADSRGHLDISTHLGRVVLYPDQAVPLSLLATEAITNAAKYAAGANGARAAIDISLTEKEDGELVFETRNSINPEETTDTHRDDTGDGLGGQLIKAFAAQLGAEVETSQNNGHYTLTCRFTPKGFTPAETHA